MSRDTDWSWKLREATERIKTRHQHIGRKTGAPFLAVVYPPEAEKAVLKEWNTLASTLESEFEFRTVDTLAVTMSVLNDLGCENIVSAMADPMPGSNPESELGVLWTKAVVDQVKDIASGKTNRQLVVFLSQLAALYPVTGPRALMQALWNNDQISLEFPVVVLIPGTLLEPRVYSFVNQREEFMYRGDIL